MRSWLQDKKNLKLQEARPALKPAKTICSIPHSILRPATKQPGPRSDLHAPLSFSALWSAGLERRLSSPCISPAVTVGIAVTTGGVAVSTRVAGSPIPASLALPTNRIRGLLATKAACSPSSGGKGSSASWSHLLCLSFCPSPLSLLTGFLSLHLSANLALCHFFFSEPDMALEIKDSYL